jgi:hypothetical protein
MKGILAATLFFLFTPSLHAGVLKLGQWIPWTIVQSGLEKDYSEIDHSGVEENVSLSAQGIHPSIRRISWRLKSSINEMLVGRTGLTVSTDDLSLEVLVEGISVDQVVVLEQGGNEIRVRVKSTCTPVQLSLYNVSLRAQAKLTPDETNLVPLLNSLSVIIPQDSFTLSAFSCNGIEGLGKVIASKVKSLLSTPKILSDLALPWAREGVVSLWSESLTNLNQGLQGELAITGMQSLEKGLMILADYPLVSGREVDLPSIDESALSMSGPQLIMSREGFNALLSDQLLSLVPDSTNLQTIGAFSDLMKSRFKQYLVWPDLRRFSSNAAFPLILDKSHYELATNPQSANWLGLLKINGVLQASMGGSLIDYLHFGLSLSTTFSVQVSNSAIHFKTGKASLNLAYSFGALYQMLFKPNQRIAADIFKDAMSSFFSNKEVKAELPELKVGGRSWKLQNFRTHKTLITMDWE